MQTVEEEKMKTMCAQLDANCDQTEGHLRNVRKLKKEKQDLKTQLKKKETELQEIRAQPPWNINTQEVTREAAIGPHLC